MKKLFIKLAISKKLHLLEIFIIANIYFWFFHSNILSVSFHPDETFWIVTTNTRFDEFINGNFSANIWNESLESFEVRPVPGYLVAVSQRLAGITPDQLPKKSWDWTVDTQTNIANGAVPNNSAIYYARLPMVILTVLCFLITMISISLIHSRLAAYSFFAISFNSYFLEHLIRAMSESPLLIFSIISIVAAYLLLQEIKKNNTFKIFLYSALTGIFCGLAGESKLNGLVCIILAIITPFAAVFKYKSKLENARIKILLISTATIIFFTLFIFISVYPFFYHDTIQHIFDTFRYRQRIMDYQVNVYPDIILPGQRTKILVNRIFSYPINFPAFLILNLFITAFGFFYGIRNIFKKRNKKSGDYYLILIVSAIIICTPVLFTPLDWVRYYLFPIFFTCIFFSIGLCQIIFLLIYRNFTVIKK